MARTFMVAHLSKDLTVSCVVSAASCLDDFHAASHPVVATFGRAVVCSVRFYVFDVLTFLIVAHLTDGGNAKTMKLHKARQLDLCSA